MNSAILEKGEKHNKLSGACHARLTHSRTIEQVFFYKWTQQLLCVRLKFFFGTRLDCQKVSGIGGSIVDEYVISCFEYLKYG